MKRNIMLLNSVIFALLLAISLQAKTVNVTDFGAIPNDNSDDTETVRLAVEDLIAGGGGTLIFPEGTIDIKSDINFITYNNYQSYLLTGDRGAFIRLNGSSDTSYFNFGNVNQAEFEGLIFYAPSDPSFNARSVISSDYTGQTRIINCSFFGIGASDALIDVKGTDLIIEKTQFDGSAALQGVVRATDSKGITVSNSSFFDYANFLDMYLSKSPVILSSAWININSESPVLGANGQRVVRITDSRFDEGAVKTIKIRNQQTVAISGISVNVSGTDDGAGIYLDNVKFADIKYSVFGFSPSPRPAIEILNNSNVEATALTFNEGVYYLKKDGTSTATSRFCSGCQTSSSKVAKK